LAEQTLRIALLHLAPVPAAVADNRNLVEEAIVAAAKAGADWIVTPELVTTGYTFADQIGTDWILPQPDPWMAGICRLAARLQVTLFLTSPERDRDGRTLYNTVFVIGRNGEILGRHRKINTLRVGSEAWSTPGREASTIVVPPIGSVGLLICADAYTPGIVKALKADGAKLLVSPANWAPGFHGPEGVWERATRGHRAAAHRLQPPEKDTTLSFVGAERRGPWRRQRLPRYRPARRDLHDRMGLPEQCLGGAARAQARCQTADGAECRDRHQVMQKCAASPASGKAAFEAEPKGRVCYGQNRKLIPTSPTCTSVRMLSGKVGGTGGISRLAKVTRRRPKFR
jgi:predicted amidohydrolase